MATSGYSGTPLAKKIGVKPGHRVHLAHRPCCWQIPDPPDGCMVRDARLGDGAAGSGGSASAATAGADITVAFYRAAADLTSESSGLVHSLADHAMLWIAWPRRAAGHTSDITENLLREIFLPLGVVDVKVAALGDDWSGLKFVRRKENRTT
ncbi:hypothetical protein [Sphaerisporangium sp. NPDC051011]|uniref:hypothetical protein n=1 Tax=Sphaerisporangium sp. NPDC051011 TaxID=3155792 RepID=UPI0033D398FB